MEAKQSGWNALFAHAPAYAIRKTSPLADGLQKATSTLAVSCEDCLENKLGRENRKPADNSIQRNSEPLDFWFTVLCVGQ